jgi:hypothetical protein
MRLSEPSVKAAASVIFCHAQFRGDDYTARQLARHVLERAHQAAPGGGEGELPALCRAIVDATRGEASFWLGEILLAEIEKETGYRWVGEGRR